RCRRPGAGRVRAEHHRNQAVLLQLVQDGAGSRLRHFLGSKRARNQGAHRTPPPAALSSVRWVKPSTHSLFVAPPFPTELSLALVRGITWLVTLRPVLGFLGKIWSRLPREIRGHVYCVAGAQRIALTDGHVGLDKARSDAQSRHPSTDIE